MKCNFDTIEARGFCVHQLTIVITLYGRYDFIHTHILSPKCSVSLVCLINAVPYYETQEFSVRKISYDSQYDSNHTLL